ncbi:hypothetical protein [Thermoactinospora rubra]|uniref:hypothetical protein n=1 Tax=Thermoactinospora rubra TaxID=1088767 RepID=UPI000A11BEB2|nr:hypothetical protein [Thermoactinospora rubra]
MIRGRLVLAITGMGPYCLVAWTEDLRPGQRATALCTEEAVVYSLGGELVVAHLGDPIHPACRKAAGARLRLPAP